MGSSEEISQINSALTHCAQLKSQLNSTLLHIQRLDAKYNQTDYMAVIRTLDNYRRSSTITSSPYPNPKQQRQRDHSNDESNSYRSTSTPVKRQTMFRRRQFNDALTSTPKTSRTSQSMMADSFEMCQSDFDTPKRTVREMRKDTNTISVRTIKVQRNIEAIITHLEVMQRSNKKRQLQQMEQSLYQSCNSSFGSPGSIHNHSSMGQSFSSFGSSFGCNNSVFNTSAYQTPNQKLTRSVKYDRDQRTLEKLQRFYATPLQRMHKRLTHLNASLVSTC